MGEFSIFHLLIVLVVVLLVFGPSRLPSLGHSLGKAIRGFKSGMKDLTDSVEEKDATAAREALPPSETKTEVVTDKTTTSNKHS